MRTKYLAIDLFSVIVIYQANINKFAKILERHQKNFNNIKDWKNINELIPKFYTNKKMKRTGLAGIFAASLELTKEGSTKILQEKIFQKIMIKKINT